MQELYENCIAEYKSEVLLEVLLWNQVVHKGSIEKVSNEECKEKSLETFDQVPGYFNLDWHGRALPLEPDDEGVETLLLIMDQDGLLFVVFIPIFKLLLTLMSSLSHRGENDLIYLHIVSIYFTTQYGFLLHL